MEKPRFEFAKRANGSSEFEDFLDSLTAEEADKLLMVIRAIEEHGLQVARKLKWVNKIENNLYEIRTEQNKHWLRGLYFKAEGSRYIITHGFKKKTNKTPEKEKKHAREVRKRWQS